MTGAGGFIKEGTGDVVMNQTSTYTGGTIIRAGRIGLNNGDALGTGTIQVDAGAVLGIGGVTLNNAVTGTGSIIKTANNVAELLGNNSGFSGLVGIQDGGIEIRNGNALGTGSVNIGAGTFLRILNSTGDSTIAAALTGDGQFFKTDTNRVTLTGLNTLTGNITVTAGTLQAAGSQNLGSGKIDLVNLGSILDLSANAASTLSNQIIGSGRLVKTGTGTVMVTGPNGYLGGTDIQQGAIRVTDTSFLGSGAITVQAGAALDLAIAGAQTLNPVLSGAGILRKSDVGDLTLLGNSLTGGLDIIGGRVIVNSVAALGSGPVSTAAGTRLVIDNAAAQTLAQSISGAGGLTKSGSGLLTISGASSFTGGSAITAGRVDLASGQGLGSGGIVISSGAQLGLGAVTVGNAISGAGRVIKFGSGTGSLTGANSYSGGTDIQGGTLTVASPGALGSGGVSIASGAALDVNYAGSAATTLANALSGAGALTKNGAGTVNINAANSYTGGTTINGGRLTVGNAGALGTGGIVVNANGQLVLGAIALGNTISGAGKVIKTGSGTGSLTGANSYSGGTEIEAGTLAVTSPGALGTGAVNIAGGSLLSITHTGTSAATLSNGLTGAGGLVKEGSGALALAGAANSYSGGTTINAGRIDALANGALGSGGIVVASGAQLGLGAISLANIISGAGKVIKSGSGTGTLSGANSHSGGTDIEAGTLAVSSPGVLGAGAVNIASGALLSVTHAGSASAALANPLTGSGSLAKEGAGTLTIDTSNTYSGGTAINGGRIAIGASDALGSGGIAVASAAELGIGAVTLANVVSGAGRIVKTGSGAASLTGANTHSGGIDIQAGSLAVSGNAPLGTGAVSIASGASLNYTNAAAATFASALSGAGTFAKLGTGQLTFGSNFTVGSLAVNAGRVRLNAVGTTNASVAAGATLDGTGRLIGTLTNNGTIAPGNSIGTLTVQGNYVHNAAAVLEIEFDAAGNIDLLDVTGSATLNGGTLRFVSIGGAEGQGGTFLRTGGTLTGTFASVETTGAALPLAVIYEANRAFMAPSVLTARPSTVNAQVMAAADTALGFVGSLGAADVRQAGGSRIWMQGFGAWGQRSASGTTLAYDHDSRGLAGGITFAAGDAISVGLAVGWAKSDIVLGSNGGGGDQSSVLGSIHARYAGPGFTLGGGLLYGKVDQKTLRNVSFNGFSASVNGATDSKMLGAFAELGLPLGSSGGWAFSAQARGSWLRQTQDAYTESGSSPLRLTVGKLRASTIEGQALLSAKTSLWDKSNGGEETPEGLDLRFDLGGRYLGTAGNREIPVTFSASNAGIVLQGDTRDSLHGLAGVALDYTLPGGATFSLGYRGELGQTDRHTVQAGVSFAF